MFLLLSLADVVLEVLQDLDHDRAGFFGVPPFELKELRPALPWPQHSPRPTPVSLAGARGHSDRQLQLAQRRRLRRIGDAAREPEA